MQLTTAIFTTLCLALSATADQRICLPLPGGDPTVPESVRDLDNQIKVNWGVELCNESTFPSEALQISTTPIEEGFLAEDGHTYGVQLALRFITDLYICVNNVQYLLGDGACPEGGLLTLSGPFEQWAQLVALD